MRRLLPLLALALVLAGCGTHAQATQSPAEVHTAWITALRANDRQAAQALLANDAAIGVDRALEQAQYLVTLDTPQTGRLQAVDVVPPVAQGKGQLAQSIWRLDRLTSCFRATLAETPVGWRVIDWAEYQTDCPKATGVSR